MSDSMPDTMYIVDPNNYTGHAHGFMSNDSSHVQYTNPRLSFGEYKDRYGDQLIACTRDEYRDVYFIPYYQSLQQPWKEITEERFEEMLNVMPPLKWRMIGNHDTFYVCEAIICDLSSIFARDVRTNQCWEAVRPIATSLDVLSEELKILP